MATSTTDYTTNWEKTIDPNTLVPFSRAVITPAISISVGGRDIGYIQNFTPTQNRPANPMYEVGTEGIIEHVIGQPTYTFTITKLAVYKNNLLRIFQERGASEVSLGSGVTDYLNNKAGGAGQPIFSLLVDLPLPFTIKVMEKDPSYSANAEGNSTAITTTEYPDCILTSYSKPINAAGDLTIAETANGVCRKPKYSI